MTKEIFPVSTPKEIFLELIKPDGQPERQLCQYEALHMCLTDPINTYLRGNRKRGSVSKDRWGTTISFPEDAPGPIPVHTPELSVCTDVTRWKGTIHVPDLSVCSEGWEECRTRSRAAAPAGTSSPRSPTALPVRSSRTWISTSIRP